MEERGLEYSVERALGRDGEMEDEGRITLAAPGRGGCIQIWRSTVQVARILCSLCTWRREDTPAPQTVHSRFGSSLGKLQSPDVDQFHCGCHILHIPWASQDVHLLPAGPNIPPYTQVQYTENYSNRVIGASEAKVAASPCRGMISARSRPLTSAVES